MGCITFSLLLKEYSSSAVNELTNNHNISYINKKDILQLIFAHRDEK